LRDKARQPSNQPSHDLLQTDRQTKDIINQDNKQKNNRRKGKYSKTDRRVLITGHGNKTDRRAKMDKGRKTDRHINKDQQDNKYAATADNRHNLNQAHLVQIIRRVMRARQTVRQDRLPLVHIAHLNKEIEKMRRLVRIILIKVKNRLQMMAATNT
jgi:hypothetical protein